MSTDYEAGRRGEEPPLFELPSPEFEQGRADRRRAESASLEASQPRGNPFRVDTTWARKGGVTLGRSWAVDPDGTLKGMLSAWAAFTLLGIVVGALVGAWLHDGGLWLAFGKITYFFVGILLVPVVVAVTLVGKGTLRGLLTVVMLGGLMVNLVLGLVSH
jgi:hypothetical protein